MRTATLSIRVDPNLVTRLDAFEAKTGVERASLVRAAIGAALDCFEKEGRLIFPLKIIDASIEARLSKSGKA